MTTLMLQAAPFVEFVTPKIRSFYQRFLHTLDAIAEAKLRNAVPERQLQQTLGAEIEQPTPRHQSIAHSGGIRSPIDWDDFWPATSV